VSFSSPFSALNQDALKSFSLVALFLDFVKSVVELYSTMLKDISLRSQHF
jgi:hypothetical protein